MKVFGSLMTVSMLFAAGAFAHDMNGPCASVFKACESAGFVKGDDAPHGRDLWDDCKKPLLDGKTVVGVSVDTKDIQRCKQFKEDKKEWMKHWKDRHED